MAVPGVATLDVADVQGLVVRGYGRLPHAAFLLCAVRDPQAARALLRDRIGDVATGLDCDRSGHDASDPSVGEPGTSGRSRLGGGPSPIRHAAGDDLDAWHTF